ncbi:MAG TPA: cupin domain-containing protein [Patescibacteria group bacterium]|nr:cupin domain-containing protein [Patescibacteria group bacterium]
MSSPKPYSLLLPRDASWRDSKMMKIPNANLAEQLGSEKLGARLWRLPPFSANTWHKHKEQDELYFVLEGTGRIRVGTDTLTIPRYGAVLVRPSCLRQVFNDTAEEALWLILGAPRHEDTKDMSVFYPEDPRQMPAALGDRRWPPE